MPRDVIEVMMMRALALLLPFAAGLSVGVSPTMRYSPLSHPRARPIVTVDSWYDSGIRLTSEQSPKPTTSEAPKRETAEEAWARAPEGSFLSPALAAGLVATGLAIKVFVLEGGSPFG